MKKHVLDYQAIGSRLHEARQAKNITQQELAQLVGVSTSYIGHLERGIKRGSLDAMAYICQELDISMDFLLTGIDFRKDKNAVIRQYLENQLVALDASTHS